MVAHDAGPSDREAPTHAPLVHSGEPDGGPHATARRRYWDAIGDAHIELIGLAVDPPSGCRPFEPPTCEPYRTGVWGDLMSQLEAAGWNARELPAG